jgi:hypothetical protein
MSHEDIPSLDVDRVFVLVPEAGRFVEESRGRLGPSGSVLHPPEALRPTRFAEL